MSAPTAPRPARRPLPARPVTSGWTSNRTGDDAFGPGESAGGTGLVTLLALAVPVAVAFARPLPAHQTTGSAIVLLTAPLWLRAFVQARAGLEFLLVGGLAIGSGFLLTWISSSDHVVSYTSGATLAIRIGSYLCAVGALWWAARVVGMSTVVILFAGTLLLVAGISPHLWGDNAWKFAFSAPVALIVLALCDRTRSTFLRVAALGALGLYSVLNDSRSATAMFMITALVLLWQQLRSGSPARKPSTTGFIVALIAVAAGIYYTLTTLMVSGALGSGLKERSERQVESSGSLLLGGRPEWTVTTRLMREHVWGFGFGVSPSQAEIELGREGFASIHLSSQEGYLYNYVFEGGFRLHSILADLWSAAGIGGVLLALAMLWLLTTSLAEGIAARTAGAVQIYLTLRSVWDIGFSPIYSALPLVALALTVALANLSDRSARGRAGPPGDRVPAGGRPGPARTVGPAGRTQARSGRGPRA